jgi:hypothetical protein
MQPAAAIKVKNIDPLVNTTFVQVGGGLYIDPGKTIFADTVPPHIHVGEPPSIMVTGGLDVGSSDIHAENVNSNLCFKTKYLEATAGAIDIQFGASSDLAMVGSKKLKVDKVRKMFANKVSIADNVEIQGSLIITRPTTITIGTISNVYSKAEVDQTFANLIDSAAAALSTLKELSLASNNDANYAATVQIQLSNKADTADTYTNHAVVVEITNRISGNNSELSAVYATKASLGGKQDTLHFGTVVANTNAGSVLSGTRVK